MYNEKTSYDMISQEETLELLKRAQSGDQEAQDVLVRCNIGLVASIAKKFLNRGYDYEDLFQLGSIGIIKAIKNFNSEFNVKFSTYAVPMIMGEIKRFLRDDGMIKVSRNLKETSKKVKIIKERLAKEEGREASVEEVAKELGISSEDVILSLESTSQPGYLYETIHQDDGSPVLLIDKIGEDRDYGTEVVNKIALKDLIGTLDSRSRQVIILRYFKDMTQNQIAQILGISQVQVSRIEKKVLKYLKESLS
ncbi:RNA polymerase sporulation sigma factor SigF [Clostridium cylindrosporum]|uniref:RNA polymerase sigma-F factor SigF n=1 Tax=Clostridium cylindrosporum DSM 605 TaxID=1121307 RepID=A0A0J8D9Q6_CLOCY|nr:RNA polymerase sporulation sigma factor SigF [Clostridium cylindrosporum]KMT22577.1 RNA polymerase sigma-F factor SigF [Clostridium cylindrosporum DSM 605]